MIHVIADISLRPHCRDSFLKEFHKLVPLVLAEEGCLEYGPTIDLATGLGAQGSLRDDLVVVVEKWQSLEHLKRHLSAPHMETYRKAVQDLTLGTRLVVLEPA